MKAEFKGGKEIEEALSEFKKAAGKAILRRAGIKALQPFDEAWRANAPRKEGHLATSGGVGTRLTTRQARIAKRDPSKTAVTIYAGPNDPSAIPQEIGTFKEPAQPYVRPAWDQEKEAIPEAVGKEIWTEIEKARVRAARRALKLKG